MNKGIDKTEFWKERIELAKKQGFLHYSVYLANPGLWKVICDTHEKIIKKEIKPEDSVLDIGCGYGRLSPLFENYLGIDFSLEFIQEAEKLFPDKQFLVADIKKLPFEDNEFNWGIAVSIKNMFIGNLGKEAWEPIEKEIKRVCKKILILEYGKTEDYTDNKDTIGVYEIL